jgi:hypothetical protein
MTEFGQFLPIGPVQTRPKPAGKKPADPESSPERQLSRRLGSNGADILRDEIKVDYDHQLGDWKTQVHSLTTAFSLALGQQKKTLDDAENQRRAAAELQAFFFSLVTAGVLRWAGAWVEYRLVPRLLATQWSSKIAIAFKSKRSGGYHPLMVTELDYNRQMAAFVGNLIPDVGNLAISYLGKDRNPDPYAGLAAGDHVSLVSITEDELKLALEDGTKVVGGQIERAIVWMNTETEFGDAWRDFAGGNETRARDLIRAHLQNVRDTWASKWPYFGQKPKPFDRHGMSMRLERMLWAGYLNDYFEDVLGLTYDKMMAMTAKAWVDDTYGKHGRNFYPKEAQDDLNEMYFPSAVFDFPDAIVTKLKNLNVIKAETAKGAVAQKERVASGAPHPTVKITDEVDRFGEILRLWGWARNSAIDESIESFSTEGTPRALPAIK